MPRPKPPELDDILTKPADDESATYVVPAARKPAAKPVKAGPRKAQAWRAIEDMKANRHLDSRLKEVYEDE